MQRVVKKITEQELIKKFIKEIYHNASDINALESFSWADVLMKAGFNPELSNIDFVLLKSQLNSEGVKFDVSHIIFSKGSFSNLRLSRCRFYLSQTELLENVTAQDCTFSLDVVKKKYFNNCHFIKCLFQHFQLEDSVLEKVTIDQCELDATHFNNVIFIDSHITQSKISLAKWNNVAGLTIEEYAQNETDRDSVLTNMIWEGANEELAIDKTHAKKNIVMLFMPEHGVVNTRLTLQFYQQYDLNIILIHPQRGMNHIIFNEDNLHWISGIILPGGGDISPSEARTAFEIKLLTHAIQREIPTLGICRGHQLIGSYFGGEVRTMTSHRENTIHVKLKADSLVYQRLQQKHDKYTHNPTLSFSLSKDINNIFTYQSVCRHKQALFFNKKTLDKKVRIVAKASDGIVEALEIGTHIITYQHHHERFIKENQEPGADKVAKALLKLFVTKVKNYAEINMTNGHVLKPGKR